MAIALNCTGAGVRSLKARGSCGCIGLSGERPGRYIRGKVMGIGLFVVGMETAFGGGGGSSDGCAEEEDGCCAECGAASAKGCITCIYRTVAQRPPNCANGSKSKPFS